MLQGSPELRHCKKILRSLRRLADGSSYSSLDDQARMGIENLRKSFVSFIRALKKCYRKQFLNRIPNEYELRFLEQEFSKRNFPGCIASLDCIHLHWKNCPRHLKGQFHNPKSGKLATIQVEAVSGYNLYCWHVHSSRPGTKIDIALLESSPLVISIFGDKINEAN